MGIYRTLSLVCHQLQGKKEVFTKELMFLVIISLLTNGRTRDKHEIAFFLFCLFLFCFFAFDANNTTYIHYNTMHCSTVQHYTIPCTTVQHDIFTVVYKTVLFSASRHITNSEVQVSSINNARRCNAGLGCVYLQLTNKKRLGLTALIKRQGMKCQCKNHGRILIDWQSYVGAGQHQRGL